MNAFENQVASPTRLGTSWSALAGHPRLSWDEKEGDDLLQFVYPVFQPIFSLSDGALLGFEALARWAGPGNWSVNQLLARVDALGLHARLAGVMLGHARELHESLKTVGLDEHSINVNLPPNLLAYEDGAAQLINAATMSADGLAWLTLEVTESCGVLSTPNSIANLALLRGEGVRIGIDDFGSEHSDLERALDTGADVLKLDGEIFRSLAAQQDGPTVLQHIAGIGRLLNAFSIVEGVETEEQFRVARHAGFDAVQGYFTGRPNSFATAVELTKSACETFALG